MQYKPFGIPVEEEGRRSSFIRRVQAPDRSGFSYHFKKGNLRYADLRETQISFLWRVMRAHAVAKYQLNAAEALDNLDNPMLWMAPMPDSSPATRSRLVRDLGDTWADLPLIPSDQDIIPDYLRALGRTQKLLGISFPDAVVSDSIYYGLDDVQNYPSISDITEYEHAKCLQIQNKFYALGSADTLLWLKQEGFSKHEAMAILKLAHRVATEHICINDPDLDRKIMIGRLESVIGQARDEMNVRAELSALTTLAKVQGLDRDVQVNPMEEFITLIRQAGTHDTTSQRALPAPGETWVEDNGNVDARIASISDDNSGVVDI